MSNISTTEHPIYSVSQLTREVRTLLELSFATTWVEGEISNLRDPGSGHLYFSLKDASAQVRCAMFRMRAGALGFRPKDGMHVLLRGKISLYEERGDFQLIVDFMEETGDGALKRAFEILKQRLDKEGLFATEHKKSLPRLPHCIGVITSPTGAAIRDILSVLRRRFAKIPVVIYPTLVQGSEAAPKIAQALALANRDGRCDVLLLARGGGSLEDLWPFNEEIVARAIFASQIPVVSGIGHEIDFTIADLVADQRAATPSAAAELVSPDASDWLMTLHKIYLRLAQAARVVLRHTDLVLQSLEKRLPHPLRRLQDQAQHLDGLEQRLRLAYQHMLKHKLAALAQLSVRLQRHSPAQQILVFSTRCEALSQQLRMGMQHQLIKARQSLEQLMRALDGVSPLNTLQRGYAIVMQDGKIVDDAGRIQVGDKVCARLAKGQLECVVEQIEIGPKPRLVKALT
ncbi:MAG TPA: exodeoxyribonuclease VII large subunit [Gammaproteobacteria bacterium]|nr:exodeoxyribonuclease VII large subunit [Gammaproteobacteria bacterium]